MYWTICSFVQIKSPFSDNLIRKIHVFFIMSDTCNPANKFSMFSCFLPSIPTTWAPKLWPVKWKSENLAPAVSRKARKSCSSSPPTTSAFEKALNPTDNASCASTIMTFTAVFLTPEIDIKVLWVHRDAVQIPSANVGGFFQLCRAEIHI